MTADDRGTWKERTKNGVRRAYLWGERHLPPGVRALLGVPLIIAGIFGFLPILGFWMVPLGLALVALDVPPLRRRLQALLDLPEPAADSDLGDTR